jgi:hypothetical protein
MRIRQYPSRLLLLILIAVAAAGLAAGCSQANNNGMKAQRYSNDGYLGTTNANPHMPGRNMALNYENDAKLMRDSIRHLPGINDANITFNGAEAYVTLKVDPTLESRRVLTLERQAAAALRFNFPRYTIHVRSMK